MLELEYGFKMEDDPAFPLCADAVQLAHELVYTLPKNARVCELGCGAGAVSLLVCAARQDVSFVGVELREKASELAKNNARENVIASRFQVVQGDIRNLYSLSELGVFDAVCANPPYRKEEGGRLPQNKDTAISCTEIMGNIRDFCAAAACLLPHGGCFTVVYPPERFVDLSEALRNTHLEPKILRFVHPSHEKPACMILVHARRDGKPGLTVNAPLFLSKGG